MSVSISVQLEAATKEIIQNIEHQLERRAHLGANELRNAALIILRGQGSGRRYRVPGTKRYYTASAPGSPPAVRTGAFRLSWQPTSRVVMNSYFSRIESDLQVNGYTLGRLLEDGTKKMAARPHHEKIQEKAEPAIQKIYDQPYF